MQRGTAEPAEAALELKQTKHELKQAEKRKIERKLNAKTSDTVAKSKNK